MIAEQSFAIYVLDDYSVHLMLEAPQALLKKDMFKLLLVVA